MIKIKVWGVINMQTSAVVESAVSALKDDKEHILLMLNSVGGTLSDSIAIRNLLDSVPNPITTVALGNCCSAAAMLFAAGNHRYVGKDITYMIHQPYVPTIDNQNLYKAKIKEKKLEQYSEIYKRGFSEGTKIPQTTLKSFEKGEDLYLQDDQCLKYKIATHLFKGYNDLYKNENINLEEEEVIEFDAIILEKEEF